jgi:lysophospholipase L1-like esterase
LGAVRSRINSAIVEVFELQILLLGGSNAGVKDGWAAQFSQLAEGHRVENCFLGAVGSLYGLMVLLKAEREWIAQPDLIILEYCLNDILLLDAKVLRLSIVIDSLRAIADFCAERGIRLFLVNLAPQPTDNRRQQRAIRNIDAIYARVATQRDIPCLHLRDVFPDGPGIEDFRDENHLSREAAGRVARALHESVMARATVPKSSSGTTPRFLYVDATKAQVSGPVTRKMLESRVFSGPFLEIGRGGASVWKGHGSLVALMLQSNDRSGVYAIRSSNRAMRRTSRSRMQEIVKNLMLLHYLTCDLPVRGEVEISMPADEADLLRLPVNAGLLEAPALMNFDEQTLTIHGVIFWRNDHLTKLRDLLLSMI